MCFLCDLKSSHTTAAPAQPEHDWSARRAFLLAGSAAAVGASAAALAQVEVGKTSSVRKLVPAAELDGAANQQYGQMMEEARQNPSQRGETAAEQHGCPPATAPSQPAAKRAGEGRQDVRWQFRQPCQKCRYPDTDPGPCGCLK